MKELNAKRKDIDYKVRLRSAIREKNIKLKMDSDRGTKYVHIKTASEAYHATDLFRDADTIGITLYYPNKELPTHVFAKSYPFDIPNNSLTMELKRIYKEFDNKIPKTLKRRTR